jgi:hypothetical protein
MSAEDLKVIPRKKFWTEIVGVSFRTGERLEAAGDCPVKTKISPHRVGFRVDHSRQWLDAQKQVA